MNETVTESANMRRLKSDREWYGYLTLENFDAVTDRIRSMLTGHRYTWVSCNEGLRDFFPEVRTGQRIREGITVDRKPLDDGRDWAHFTVGDTYGVWGLSTTIPDQEAARDFAGSEKKGWSLTYLHFKHGRYDEGRIEIEHYNGYGDRLYWIVAVETEDDSGDDPRG